MIFAVESHYATVLVPLDGSLRAAEALPRAVEIARKHDATVVLLHVLPPGESTPERRARRVQMEAYLEGLKRSLARSELKVGWLIEDGAPAETIASVAGTLTSPVIVLAHSGLTASGTSDTSAGTVTAAVSRLWTGPTLVV